MAETSRGGLDTQQQPVDAKQVSQALLYKVYDTFFSAVQSKMPVWGTIDCQGDVNIRVQTDKTMTA